ncbi:hypothetical protein [Photorhabdus luminescens]|uniref:Inner membrane protein yafU n=1 Tax=Photorhabdus luminescens subsp. mexicana TaxID=2100167 RepID=A0A4R4IYA6_PHOLU|nr:hypothetical protein [Photorhabdus luminescens]TDB45661.1 hypothetical protein C5468_20045 [Photorhabdus luminescens subsp. mexicana]
MKYKKYNPSVEGYMGDFLRGNVGINQLKPQHEFFDAVGLEKVLNDNTIYIALLTPEEAVSILSDINPFSPTRPKIKLNNYHEKVFYVTDPISPFAGNIHDFFGFSAIVREFKSIGITATEYFDKNGKCYIKISGHAGLRRIITGTRYGANNLKMLSMGIGQQGLNSSIVKGVKFCIIFSVMYRTIEAVFKDEYTLADFIGNITVDMAKTAIIAATSWAAGSFISAIAVVGGSIIVAAGIVLLVGFLTAVTLEYIDKKYGISAKIIKLIKDGMERKPRTPEIDLQNIFNNMGKV